MQKVEVLCGIPGSGKSSYAEHLMKKEPGVWKRLNNDSIRISMDFGVWSKENEKIVKSVRKYILQESLKSGFNVVVDNLNLGKRNFDEIVEIVKSVNRDCQVYEKIFYIELDEAIERDSKRIGSAHVGEKVIRKWWNDSGKNLFKFHNPRTETIFAKARDKEFKPLKQDENLKKAAIFDNDGTISLIGNRSPYDASKCDEVDAPFEHVIELLKLYHNSGYKIIFVSGRQEKDRASTERFYKKHFPEIKYELYMRPTEDMRKDVQIKKEIYENHIKGKYFISAWFDDRLQICSWLHEEGFPLFRVGDPEANF